MTPVVVSVQMAASLAAGPTKVNWGDVPTWLTGILTGLAVLITGIGLLLEVRRSRRQRDRGQAELVAAWQDRLSLDAQDYSDALQNWRGDQPDDTSAVGAVVFIRIRNASQLPVYAVRYRVDAGVRGTFVDEISVLPPGTAAEVAIPLPSAPRGEGAPPEIAFSDSGNRRWWRNATGVLANGDKIAFKAGSGAHESVEQHPTIKLPRPLRFGVATYSEETGQLVRPREWPYVW